MNKRNNVRYIEDILEEYLSDNDRDYAKYFDDIVTHIIYTYEFHHVHAVALFGHMESIFGSDYEKAIPLIPVFASLTRRILNTSDLKYNYEDYF